MVYRFSWIAGLGVGFALFRLERLLLSSAEGLPWEAILLAATILGGALAWAGLAFRLSLPAMLVVNLAALLITVVRIAVPATTWFIFPTASSFPALGTELDYALDVSRTGVAPVLPLAGLIAILAVVFWGLGMLLAVGLRGDRPYLAVLSPLVVYLQFSTMDRRRSGPWMVGFVLLLALALLAVAADRRRRGTGLLTTGPGRVAIGRTRPALAAGAVVLLVTLALTGTTALAVAVPRGGLLDWRVPSALTGGYYGSISYNPFVGIRQQLVASTDTPLFVTALEGDLPYDRVYFRLITLDSFDGTQWYAAPPRIGRLEEVDTFEDADMAFHGPTVDLAQTVQILALAQDWLPAVYAPSAFASAGNRALASGLRIKVDDGSLHFAALTYRGMTYDVESQVPLPDLGVLALGPDGQPSRVFAEAAAAGDYEAVTAGAAPPEHELPGADKYLALPAGMDAGISALARRQVQGLGTAFEKGLALEAFFRDSGAFRYSIRVDPGHGATDLADWLLDPQSPNYHTGYCEQFATAMAVMARNVGVPSRVVLGFTPGRLLEDGRVVVLDRNAHAWVELWMPTQGWVRFDPTPRGDAVNPAAIHDVPFEVTDYLDIEVVIPAFPPGTNPRVPLPDDDEIPDIPPITPGVTGGAWSLPHIPFWVPITLLALAAAFGLIPSAKWARRRHRLRALSTGDVSGAWREVVDRLSDLGDEPPPGATPVEVAAATDPAMASLARVYGESIYGRPKGRAFDLGQVVLATDSLRDTEARFAGRYSRLRHVAAWYRLRSLAPRRWKPRRAR